MYPSSAGPEELCKTMRTFADFFLDPRTNMSNLKGKLSNTGAVQTGTDGVMNVWTVQEDMAYYIT